MAAKAMALNLRTAVIFKHRRHKMILDVRCWQACVRTPEPACLSKTGGHHARALKPMFDDRLDHLARAGERIAEEISF